MGAECDLEEFLARKKETREICFNQRIRQILWEECNNVSKREGQRGLRNIQV